jgi:opacity protein-like surface antigen
MARHSCTFVAGALTLCLAANASAQQAGSSGEDTRTQYPAFLTNSFFSINVGDIHYGFLNQQLEPGYRAESIEIPHLAVRVGLFGHQFSKWLSAQATYTRPARFVAYRNVNGAKRRRQVREGFGGVTLISQLPLNSRVSLYGEGGLGITSRAGIEIDGTTVVRDAHFASALLGAGVEYHVKSTVAFVVGTTYSPGRKQFSQPPTRLYTMGIRYMMRPLPVAQVEDNRHAGFIFPEQVIRIGYSANTLAYGPNKFFSRTIPVFWGGDVETRRGITLDYERNVFHTRKKFAFDLGTSASYWRSNGKKEIFRTLSVYPLLRFTLRRTQRADVYVNYSLAGPSYISRTVIDGHDTGVRFTFQDFLGLGVFLGKNRSTNVEIGIKHYSNGNMFPRNAAIKIPLTLSLGHTFSHRKDRDAI